MIDTTTPTHGALVQLAEDAPTLHVLGGSIAIRVRSEDSGGRLGLVEQVVPAGYPGPAMHVHPSFEETFYVLEGSLSMRVGDTAHEAGPGTVVTIPRGTPHTFANTSGAAVRSLVLVTPGGFERYFEELVAAIEALGGVPPAADLAALGVAHGSIPV